MSNKSALPFANLGGTGKTTAAQIQNSRITLPAQDEVILCAYDESDDDETTDCGSARG